MRSIRPRTKLFTQLLDALASYAGLGGEFVKVKATEDGLETGVGGGGAHASTHEDGGADEINLEDLMALGAAPAIYIHDTNQVDPAGRFRIVNAADMLQIVGAASEGWGSEWVLFRVSRAGWVELQEVAAPGTPPGGRARVYVKTDGKIYLKNDDGTEYNLTAGAAGRPGEGHITVLPFSYDSIGQGTWEYGTDSTAYFQGWLKCASHTDGDEVSFKVYLDAGTYTILMMGREHTYCAIVDVYIDEDVVATFDWYGGSGVSNIEKRDTGNVVATAGLKTLKCKVNGKHASSTDYFLYIQYIALWRTA